MSLRKGGREASSIFRTPPVAAVGGAREASDLQPTPKLVLIQASEASPSQAGHRVCWSQACWVPE